MGFMDKTKKLAGQAQRKLDEAQQQFNQGQAQQQQQQQGVRYDEHGRPAAEPSPAEPSPPEPSPAEKAQESGANANPDPFKPIQ